MKKAKSGIEGAGRPLCADSSNLEALFVYAYFSSFNRKFLRRTYVGISSSR